MSVKYIYTDLALESPTDNLKLSTDLTLLANAPGIVTDSSQISAEYDWSWGKSGDFADSSVLHLTASTAVLTVGGDYSKKTDKNNLSVTATNDIYEVAAVRANGDLRLVLVAQTGAAGAAGLDKSISINVKSTVIRNHEQFESSIAASNQTTAMGYDVAGTLVVSSDLLGTITVASTAKKTTTSGEETVTTGLYGIQVKGSDKYEPADTSTNQALDAIGIRAGNMTLLRNFTATVTARSTAAIAGYASQTVSGNTLSAKGIRVLGDLSAATASGKWDGTITATATVEAYADKAHLYKDAEGKTPETGTATVSGNDFSAYGIWADGNIDIRHMATGKITASTADTKVNMAASGGESTGTVSFSGNSFSAYGVKGDSVNIGQIDSGFEIKASVADTTVTGTVSGKDKVATISGNDFKAIGIDTSTLTTGTFDGKVTASAKNVTFTVTGKDNEHTTDDTTYNVIGINVGELTSTDNFGGTITVTSSQNKGIGYYEKFASMLKTAGIYANDYMLVTGRINTTISVTMSKNQGFGGNPQAFGIYAKALAADAFSGSITVTAPLDLGIFHYADIPTDVVKSAGLTVGALTTTTMVSYGVFDAFDINGDITSTLAGVVAVGEVNLRVSGKISTTGFPIADIDPMAITTDYGQSSSTNADKVELASTAAVTGNIDLAGGENILVINSGAQVDGKLLATQGLMNIRFDLDETVRSNAIVKTTLDDISLASTSTISINLNNAKDGATYTLFEYSSASAKDYWTGGTRQVTFSYMGQSDVMNVSKAGTASASFTDAAGNVVSATLTYSGKKVTVAVTNGCTLEAFGGECTTTLDADKRTATLGWTDAVEAENYEVEYSIDGGKTIVVLVNGALNSTVINGIDAGTKIKWRVRGNTGDGSEVSAWSAWSDDASYAPAVLNDPVMSSATPRAFNPDEEGGGVTASRARFTWEAATGDCEIAGYHGEFIVSKTPLTPDEIAAIYADPSSIANDESKKFFTKETTATEVVATSLTNQSYVYWRVRAKDVDGRESEFKDGEAFRIWVGDNVKPVWRKLADDETDRATAVVDPDRHNAYDVRLNVDFTWISAEDTQSGVKSYLLQYKLAGDSWFDETKVSSVTVAEDGSKTYGAKLENLAGGLYDYRIKAVDYVGNESEYLVTSQFGASDFTPPSGKFTAYGTPVVTGTWSEVTVTDEQGNETTGRVLTGVTVQLSWSDNFKDDSDIVYTVEVSDNKDFLGKRVYSFETKPNSKSLTLDDSVGTASAVLAGMGTVYYRIKVADSVGNKNPQPSPVQSFKMVDSSTHETISFSPKAAAPTGLSMSKSKVAVGSSYRTDLTFKWSDGDNSFGVYDYTLSVTANGTTTKYTGITAKSYTLASQVDGNYSWSVTANTGTGSSATATGTAFTVDATAPLFAEGASATVVTALGEFAINWDAATDKNGIQGYFLEYGSGTDTSTWTTVAWPTTSYEGSIDSSGDYNYRIYAVDNYNNTSLEALSYISGSFSITTESHLTSDTAKVISVTDVRDEGAASFGSVGMKLAAEWLKFTVDENDADVYLSIDDVVSSNNNGSGVTVKGYTEAEAKADKKKAFFTASVAKGDQKLQFHFAEAGTYYLEVTPKKSASIMAFSVAAASNVATAAELTQEDNEWNGKDQEAGKLISSKDYAVGNRFRQAIDFDAETGNVAQELVDDYVGKADAVDYRRFDVLMAGSYDFTVTGVASPLQLSIYGTTLDILGNVASVKEVKKVTLSPKYDTKKNEWIDSLSTGGLLLDAGTYYFSVTAKDAAKNKNSVYQVAVEGEAFVKVNTADDDWTALAPEYTATVDAGTKEQTIDLFGTADEPEWVGYGDAIDYRKLTILQSGNYNFTISGASNAATLTIYTVNAKSGKRDKYKSISVNGTKTTEASTGDLLVDVSKEPEGKVFYVEVTANDWKKGKNTDYTATVTVTGFVDGNNEDDDWTALVPDGEGYEEYEKYKKTINAGTAATEFLLFGTAEDPEWVGFGDASDYRKLTIDQSGSYDFTLSGASNSVTLTIYTYNEKKDKRDKVKSITVNGTKVASGTISGLLVDASKKAQVFYVAVTANDWKKARNSYYQVAVTGTGFVKANNEDDDWTDLVKDDEEHKQYDKYKKTIAAGTKDGSLALFKEERDPAEYPDPTEWVGFGDEIDYRRLTIDQTGSYDFTLTLCGEVKNSATLTIYTENAKKPGTLSKYKSISVNAAKTATGTIGGLLVEAGTTYYVEVKANDAKKGKNTDYEVSVGINGFVYANMADDDTWQDAADPEWGTTKAILAYDAAGKVTNTGISKDEWVGFGDAVDYREITAGWAGKYNFNVNLGDEKNNVKLTVWSLTQNSKGEDVVKQLKSITVNAAKTNIGEITDLLLDKGTYYVSVEATDAKKGKNSDYDLSVTGVGFVKANNEDDKWEELASKYTISDTTSFEDWVGFGDKIDYRAVKVAEKGGIYSFQVTGVDGGVMNNVKLTVYTESNGKLKTVKSVTATVKNGTADTGDLCLVSDNTYYLAVEAPDAAKGKNSDYTLSMTERGVFTHRGNETWETATEFDSSAKGLLTTAAGGDKIDYFDLSYVVDDLKLNIKNGKTKVSFFDENNKAVKVANVTMADGSVKKNVSSLTLVADDATTDTITLASLDDSIRYLKIEAATNGINTYKLTTLAS